MSIRNGFVSFLVLAVGVVLLAAPGTSVAQHQWQKPKPLVAKAHLEKIIGPITAKAPSRKLNVLWVWGYDKHHHPGAHDYLRVRDLMTGLIAKVPDVTIKPVYLFPTKDEFAKADLVVMYLHLPQLTGDQYANFIDFIKRGGGAVALHETAIIRPAAEGKKLAQCLGMAWDEGRSKWGAIFEDISIDNSHEIFKGFPKKLRIVDEFYWDLNRVEGTKILGTGHTGPPRNSRSPLAAAKLSKAVSPMFWTLEQGKGRVFGTTLGHNTFSYYDPELRIVLFRAMAWAVREKADPFMPLVYEGITNDKGMVGTVYDMRNWKGKLRQPPKK
jgi:type 1 glutamine amidotransferase